MLFLKKMTLGDYWRQLLLNICEPIYKLIVYLYELFEVVGTAEIITNEILTVLYNRIGLLLGLYMLFRILFSFIQMLINPDYISDKEKGIGKIISKALLTILLIAITPYIFEKAIELQNFIVGVNGDKNVIASIILPDQDTSRYDDFGPKLSAYLFDSFYDYDDSIKDNPPKKCAVLDEYSPGVTMLHESIIRSKGSVSFAEHCLYSADGYVFTDSFTSKERYLISFTWNGVFAIAVGLVVCYMLLMYVISVGARVIQLAFLRIISPMAIMTFLSPKKDGMFSKWLKMCTTTYLDLFIRMAIIYFIVFLISTIMGSDVGISLAKPFDDMWIVNIVMIIALLLFAKKAPELLKELFPKSGAASLGFGLKSPKKLFDDMLGGSTIYKAGKWGARGAVGMAAGAALGFGTGLLGGDRKISGALGGMLRGGMAGIKKGGVKKVVGNQRDINAKYRKMHADGATWFDMKRSGFQKAVGMNTRGQRIQFQIDAYDQVLKKYDEIESHLDKEVMKNSSLYAPVMAAQQKLDALKEKFSKNPISLNRSDYANDIDYNNAITEYNQRGVALANASSDLERTKEQQRIEYRNTYLASDVVLQGHLKEFDYSASQAGISVERDSNGYVTYDGLDNGKKRSKQDKANLSADANTRRQKAADEASGKK